LEKEARHSPINIDQQDNQTKYLVQKSSSTTPQESGPMNPKVKCVLLQVSCENVLAKRYSETVNPNNSAFLAHSAGINRPSLSWTRIPINVSIELKSVLFATSTFLEV
jgi:hypothetical protein